MRKGGPIPAVENKMQRTRIDLKASFSKIPQVQRKEQTTVQLPYNLFVITIYLDHKIFIQRCHNGKREKQTNSTIAFNLFFEPLYLDHKQPTEYKPTDLMKKLDCTL